MATTTARPAVFSPLWWRDLASRLARQAYQIILPIMVVLAQGDTKGFDPADVVKALLIGLGVTVVRALAGIRTAHDAPLWAQAVDRAVAAFFGSVLGLAFTDGTSVIHGLDLGKILLAGASSAALAALHGYLDPGTPALTPTTVTGPTPDDATVVERDTSNTGSTYYGGNNDGGITALGLVVAVLVVAGIVWLLGAL